MFVTNWNSTTKIQKISEITNFFRHYFLSRTEVVMENFIVNVAWCDKNFGGTLGDNVPGAVVFTAHTFAELQKEAKESLNFHVEGLLEDGVDVPQWLKDGDYEFAYNL